MISFVGFSFDEEEVKKILMEHLIRIGIYNQGVYITRLDILQNSKSDDFDIELIVKDV